jgi:hypothetical protein
MWVRVRERGRQRGRCLEEGGTCGSVHGRVQAAFGPISQQFAHV